MACEDDEEEGVVDERPIVSWEQLEDAASLLLDSLLGNAAGFSAAEDMDRTLRQYKRFTTAHCNNSATILTFSSHDKGKGPCLQLYSARCVLFSRFSSHHFIQCHDVRNNPRRIR